MTKTISLFRRFVMFLLALLPFSVSAAEQFVSFHGGDLLLNGNGRATIYVSPTDCKGVARAAANLT